MLNASRVVLLEDFSEEQILQFLANLYEGDNARARARFDLLHGIENLLGLAHNPRMLAFIAALDEVGCEPSRKKKDGLALPRSTEKSLTSGLPGEAERQRHRRGLPTIDKNERLTACTALALGLWASRTSPSG